MEHLSFNLCPFREIYSRFSLVRVEEILTSTQACKQNNVSQNWKRSVLIPVLKKENVKECSNYCTIAHITHASNVMFKILQAWLQQYVNWKFQMYKLDFKKAEEPEIILLINNCWIIKKARKFQKKKSTSTSLSTLKPLTLWITTIYGKIHKEMGIPDHLTHPLRNLYAGQEAALRTRHRITDWFKIRKGVQGCILSPWILIYM